MSEAKDENGIWMDEGVEIERVRAAREGDVDAFRALARHHMRHVYRLAFALTRDHDDAADLTAETFRRARASIATLPDGKRFFPWVLRIARNLSVTLARRRAGEPVLVNARAWNAAEAPSEEIETDLRVLKLLPELRPDEQMALALRVVERLPYEQIAALLDQSVAATMGRLANARGLLLARAWDEGASPS